MSPTLRKSLILLVAVAVVVACLSILGLLRLLTFRAFSQEMRRNLRNDAFLEARNKRILDLGQLARIISWDSNLVQIWRRQVEDFEEYRRTLEKWREQGADPTRLDSLHRQRRECTETLWEQCHRLYFDRDVGPDFVGTVGCLSDLFAVLDSSGAVMVEFRSQQDGRFLVHSPLDQAHNQRPVALTLRGRPLVEAARAGLEAGTELLSTGGDFSVQDLSVVGVMDYPDGHLYQVLLAPNPEAGNLVLMGDRIDGRMAAHASQMSGHAQVVITDADVKTVLATTSEKLSRAVLKTGQRPAPDGQMQAWNLLGEEFLVLPSVLDRQPKGLLTAADQPPDPGGWMFYLKPTLELERLVHQQIGISVAITLVVILLSVATASRMAGQISAPIEELSAQMLRVGTGDLGARAAIRGPREIRAAAQAFNQMVAGLQDKETLEKFVARLEELRLAADLSDPIVRDQTQFGRHVVVERLGAGGMAAVYKALPVDTLAEDQAVAIKVMRRELASEEAFRLRFQREYRVMLGLSHPGIVRVLDSGELNGLVFITMEYLQGRVLSEDLKQNPSGLPMQQVRALTREMLEAMIYAHSQQIVHRDLKPENLMLTSSGVKIMDFGLAAATEMSRLTFTGEAFGTPSYVAPEQVGGSQPTPATDQYALGVIFFEMLTGQCPFQGGDAMAVVYQHLTQAPPSLCSLTDRVTPSLESVVLKMLAKEPLHRFPNLAEVLTAWEKAWTDPDYRAPLVAVSTPSPTLTRAPAVAEGWDQASTDDTIGFG